MASTDGFWLHPHTSKIRALCYTSLTNLWFRSTDLLGSLAVNPDSRQHLKIGVFLMKFQFSCLTLKNRPDICWMIHIPPGQLRLSYFLTGVCAYSPPLVLVIGDCHLSDLQYKGWVSKSCNFLHGSDSKSLVWKIWVKWNPFRGVCESKTTFCNNAETLLHFLTFILPQNYSRIFHCIFGRSTWLNESIFYK